MFQPLNHYSGGDGEWGRSCSKYLPSANAQYFDSLLYERLGQRPATVNWAPAWFDVSLLLTAWDRTALGEHHFISEALTVLLRHRTLEEEFLVPELRGYGNLNLTVALEPPIEIGSLWSALNVPLRSALYLTVTIPFEPQPTPVPLVWERIFNLRNQSSCDSDSLVLTRRVAIAGIVSVRLVRWLLTTNKALKRHGGTLSIVIL
ncbi:Pvc16 family protein [Nostoc sp. 'Lobaria pulmonaria (5183) cyanobiont']|uniref:Pvc16 family protein n=1 Tax=Nostoc sp. 'Lobaria pulmonaria (5183) cyanobiont' TaxID=1618022 RepID=UPI002D79927A|nr:Pvc16 family protein [Nostoc sp. 'Lobaria pulmonaria (5183) cyanobiont']